MIFFTVCYVVSVIAVAAVYVERLDQKRRTDCDVDLLKYKIEAAHLEERQQQRLLGDGK
jgi:hypothetical protein